MKKLYWWVLISITDHYLWCQRNERWFCSVITPTKVLRQIYINWKNVVLLKCLQLYLKSWFISSRLSKKGWCLCCTKAERVKDLIETLIMPCNKEERKNDSKFLNTTLFSLSLSCHISAMISPFRCSFDQSNLQ